MLRTLLRILLLCSAGAVLTACSKPAAPAQTDSSAQDNNTETETGPSAGRSDELPTFQISLQCEYGQIRAEWALPAEYEGMEQEIVLYDFYAALDSGSSGYEEFASFPVSYSACNLTDAVAWHYQEKGVDTDTSLQDLAVSVNLYEGGALVTSVMSYSLHIQDFFPAENGPVIGEDLPLESVTSLEWSGSGSTMESNFLFSLNLEETPALLYASYSDETGYNEKEIPLDEESLQTFRKLISAGTLVRKPADDPDLEILDGSEDCFRLLWADMRDCDQIWYRFIPDDAAAEELRTLFRELAGYKPPV